MPKYLQQHVNQKLELSKKCDIVVFKCCFVHPGILSSNPWCTQGISSLKDCVKSDRRDEREDYAVNTWQHTFA